MHPANFDNAASTTEIWESWMGEGAPQRDATEQHEERKVLNCGPHKTLVVLRQRDEADNATRKDGGGSLIIWTFASMGPVVPDDNWVAHT